MSEQKLGSPLCAPFVFAVFKGLEGLGIGWVHGLDTVITYVLFREWNGPGLWYLVSKSRILA